MKLPDYTVITHWHWDHTFGMHAVEGKTIAGHLTNEKLKVVMQWKWSNEDMERRLKTGEDIEMCDRCIKVEYENRQDIKVVPADMELTGQLNIDLGGIHCIIKEVEATHSNDSVFVYIPEEKVLFVGDADCEDFYNNNGKYDEKKLKNLINLLEGIDFNTYVLGHDEPKTKEEALTYLKEKLEEIN
jgi:glyoxylase-like metal-dependent hydrolase (beta-lactamase superfamily II)